jgi:hypothetical protein
MVHILSFSGQFHSINEFAMYARTERLAQGGSVLDCVGGVVVYNKERCRFADGQDALARVWLGAE